jgi:hypothetical protein
MILEEFYDKEEQKFNHFLALEKKAISVIRNLYSFRYAETSNGIALNLSFQCTYGNLIYNTDISSEASGAEKFLNILKEIKSTPANLYKETFTKNNKQYTIHWTDNLNCLLNRIRNFLYKQHSNILFINEDEIIDSIGEGQKRDYRVNFNNCLMQFQLSCSKNAEKYAGALSPYQVADKKRIKFINIKNYQLVTSKNGDQFFEIVIPVLRTISESESVVIRKQFVLPNTKNPEAINIIYRNDVECSVQVYKNGVPQDIRINISKIKESYDDYRKTKGE